MNNAAGSLSIRALLARGDDLAGAGDARAAVSFYQAALADARQARSLDPPTMERLRRAQAFIQARVQDFQQTLDHALAGIDSDDPVAAVRLHHALDLLKGKRTIYPQQPSMLYYPYLAQRQFFERDEFPWAADLEGKTEAIRAELLALLHADAAFRPYVESSPDRPARDFHGLNDNPSWTALYLWKHGTFVPEVADRCPATVKALESVPLSRIGARTPSVFFSRLEPGAHIPPHTGMLNSRLICHLPLIVPDGCWLRVGNETRSWEDGKLVIFDDSIEHEAKNPTGEIRIVLIFDIWRPELTEAERAAISAMFNAIDDFRAAPDA
jgi:aspartyl/asparaginyl beta-hydroxylase (cupin superfamily)